MNIALWIAQGLLAAMYLMAGSMKTFQLTKMHDRMPWTEEKNDGYIRFVSISEVLGALGLVLPVLVGIQAWITPAAAMGLSLIEVLAIFTVHLTRKEYKAIPIFSLSK